MPGTPESAKIFAWQTSASGLAAVWARENTREAIWDAFARKEVFATSGTRLRVRVFGGWDYKEADLGRSNFAEYGYANGVPMGGDLTAGPDGKAPTFLIQAVRDADGANLDRIQVIKGWLDASGKTHERIFDLACSDDRGIDARRCAHPVGDTVNVTEASYDNSIGDPFLQAHWTDEEFDPTQRAFYYVRVLEIPTPRWTTFDAKVFGVEIPEGAPTSIQDRAYTSPIWYNALRRWQRRTQLGHELCQLTGDDCFTKPINSWLAYATALFVYLPIDVCFSGANAFSANSTVLKRKKVLPLSVAG